MADPADPSSLRCDVASFDRFWAAYPRQQGIGAARRQWIWALSATENDAETIIAAAIRYATYCRREGIDQQFIPMPAKWLADERWKDVLPEPPRIDPDRDLKRHAVTIAKSRAWMLRLHVSDRDVREMVSKGYLDKEVADREWFGK